MRPACWPDSKPAEAGSGLRGVLWALKRALVCEAGEEYAGRPAGRISALKQAHVCEAVAEACTQANRAATGTNHVASLMSRS